MADKIKGILGDADYDVELDGDDISILYNDDDVAVITGGEIKVQDSDYISEMKAMAEEFKLEIIREYEE